VAGVGSFRPVEVTWPPPALQADLVDGFRSAFQTGVEGGHSVHACGIASEKASRVGCKELSGHPWKGRQLCGSACVEG